MIVASILFLRKGDFSKSNMPWKRLRYYNDCKSRKNLANNKAWYDHHWNPCKRGHYTGSRAAHRLKTGRGRFDPESVQDRQTHRYVQIAISKEVHFVYFSRGFRWADRGRTHLGGAGAYRVTELSVHLWEENSSGGHHTEG
jgi:hypothetical protein